MPSISCVRHQDQLFIGQSDNKTLGKRLGCSIEVYRNLFIRFFTELFGLSTTILIAGKLRCVKKTSLIQHLSSLGVNEPQVDDIKRLGYDAFILQKNLRAADDLIVDKVPLKKREKCYKKLVRYIIENNTECAEMMIFKGALLNTYFYKPSHPLKTKLFYTKFNDIAEQVFKQQGSGCFNKYTPLSLAVDFNNQRLAQLLISISGDFSSDFVTKHQINIDQHGKWTAPEVATLGVILEEDGRLLLNAL
jgi:hypothetical protein